jgi:PAS domain S-box-containing protein
MVADNLRVEVLLELILSTEKKRTESDVLAHCIPLFVRKLNCFMAALFKANDPAETTPIEITPKTFLSEASWPLIESNARQSFEVMNTSFAEFTLENQYFYTYKLATYGFLVLGKSTPFQHHFKHELSTVLDHLGRVLTRIVEDQKRKKVQEQLSLFLNLINNYSDAVQVATEEGRLFYINHVASERLGIDPALVEQTFVWDFDELFTDQVAWEEHVAELKRKKHSVLEGINKHRSSGESFPVEVTVKYIEIDNRGFVIANSRDISERKSIEKKIEQQLSLQDILIKISSTYINIALENVENTIHASLKELGEFVGADRAYVFDYDFVTNTTSNTYEWCAEGITPEIENLQQIPIDAIPAWVERHTKGEEFYVPQVSLLAEMGHQELQEILEPQGIQSLITFPMISSGRLVGFIGFDSVREQHIYTEKEKNLLLVYSQMLVNIRERKQQETLLRLQEEKYRNIISNMNLGLIEVDNDQRILFANQSFCEMSGYTLKELRDMKANTFLVTEEDKHLLSEKQALRKSGVSDSYGVAVKNKNNELRWWYISGAPNYNDQDELIGSIGVHLDITNQKKLEHELALAKQVAEEARQAEKQFLANMSHEIRTPLNAIIGMAHLLYDTHPTSDQREYLDVLKNSANFLHSLISDILDMSKVEAGQVEPVLKEIDLVGIIRTHQRVFELKTQGRPIEVVAMIDARLEGTFLADELLLNQVINNLLSNAEKFTEAGAITISVKQLQKKEDKVLLEFSVSDTGIGIDLENQHLIFEKFRQVSSSDRHKTKGTGLGLAIVKQLVEIMGGEISLESRVGEGSTFTFTIPLRRVSVDPAIQAKVQSIRPFHSQDQYIGLEELYLLVVEDNAMNQKYLGTLLSKWNIRYDYAPNGQFAVMLAEKNTYDLILMDIQMPIMDGYEATLAIRNTQNPNKKTPIVALSASAMLSQKNQALSVGMNDFISKPFTPSQLLEKLYEFCSAPSQPGSSSSPSPSSTEFGSLDTNHLYEMYGDDKSYALDMFTLFVEEIVPEIRELTTQESPQALKRAIHKLKPTFGMVGLTLLQEAAQHLEAICESGALHEEILTKRNEFLQIFELRLPDVKSYHQSLAQ